MFLICDLTEMPKPKLSTDLKLLLFLKLHLEVTWLQQFAPAIYCSLNPVPQQLLSNYSLKPETRNVQPVKSLDFSTW